MLIFSLLCSLLAIIFTVLVYKSIIKCSPGNERMQEIASYIREGSQAYLRKQYKTVALFFAIIFILLVLKSYFIDYPQLGEIMSFWIPFSFLVGGFLSALAGYFGMKIATLANVRTAEAAQTSLSKSLRIAFNSGTVMGMLVVGLGILHISFWYVLFDVSSITDDRKIEIFKNILIHSSLGASFMALFSRVGGGIFTKAADVGADLVGKVEKNIPEDDPRNPAVIADNVGDNVGDVAGMGGDLYESYVGSIIATMTIVPIFSKSTEFLYQFIMLPLVLAGIGLIASIIGSFFVRVKDDGNVTLLDLLKVLRKGIYIASLIMFVLTIFVTIYFRYYIGLHGYGLIYCVAVGLIAGNLIGFFTEYYTSFDYAPTLKLVNIAKSGPANLVIEGIALGQKSAAMPVFIISIAILLAFFFMDGNADMYQGLYGIGIASVGLLSTLGITLATDAYGPVADNAGGIAEMAMLKSETRERTNLLDALGNTTAATGKGFAIGSAALTALTFLSSYAASLKSIAGIEIISLTNPYVLVGLLIGILIPFYFSSLLMSAVGNSAFSIVEEVRRQFQDPAIMLGKKKPDYAACVLISTSAAQKEMIKPAMIGIISPLIIGSLFGLEALFSLLGGALGSGFILAIMMANSGGAWDNAKKYIEKSEKGTPSHKAAVIGDTIGDPFKDTAGPSINILIKLLNISSIIFLPLIYAINIFLYK